MKRMLIVGLLLLLISSALAQDGAPDPSFGPGDYGPGRVVVAFNLGGNNIDRAGGVAVDAQGRVVMVGTLTTNNNDIIGVVRLLANGDLDPAFSTDGKTTITVAAATIEANAVVLQPDGKVLIAGQTRYGPTGELDFLIVRLQENGAVDTSFGVAGVRRIDFNDPAGFRDSAKAIALGANGRILVAGNAANLFSTARMAVVRLTPNGDLDTSFDGDGLKSFSFSTSLGLDLVRTVEELPDGRIVLAGSTDSSGNSDFAVVRLLENGGFDPTFGNFAQGRSTAAFDLGGSNDEGASGLAVNSSGSIFVSGTAAASGGSAVIAIAKFDANGALDPTLAGSGRQTVDFAVDGASYATGNNIFLQGNGAIVVGGQASRSGGLGFDFASARLSATGVLDTSFGNGGHQLLGFDLGASNNDNGLGMVLANGYLVSMGSVQRVFNGGADRDFGILRQTLDIIFADGFD